MCLKCAQLPSSETPVVIDDKAATLEFSEMQRGDDVASPSIMYLPSGNDVMLARTHAQAIETLAVDTLVRRDIVQSTDTAEFVEIDDGVSLMLTKPTADQSYYANEVILLFLSVVGNYF
jgi:hypothetical protein